MTWDNRENNLNQDMSENTIESVKLNNIFSWFQSEVLTKIQEESLNFWENQFDWKLIGIFTDANVLAFDEEFFVTKIKLNKKNSVVLKLSKTAVEIFLDKIFQKKEGSDRFKFEDMTELEANILTEFNNAIYNSFSEKIEAQTEESDEDYQLTFYVNDEDKLGKYLIIIPDNCIKPESLALKKDVFSENNFPSSITEVDIKVGDTKLDLKDLQSLENGDYIVLEDSNINLMELIIQGERTKMQISPEPSLIVNIDNNGSKDMDNITKNMWDSIQIEVGAEFEKVKMSLGDLKQISEGLVMDIGSVYENKINLKVEEKIIANGELVIINDRYGVRINEVFAEENVSDTIGENPESNLDEMMDTEEEVPQENAEGNNEDFDYSNFDIEDENI